MTNKERYATDPEYRAKTLAVNKAWRDLNKERVSARKKARYGAAQAARASENNRKWRAANAEKHRASARRWHADNKERSSANKAKWHADNLDKHRAYNHARRERVKGAEQCDRQSLNVLTQMIASVPRMKCGICNRAMPQGDRTIDHIIPLVRGGSGNIGNLQVVHRACNSRKNDKLPHEFDGQAQLHFAGNRAHLNDHRTDRTHLIQGRAGELRADSCLNNERRLNQNN